MGNTAKHGLPWPNDTDPYQQGAYAMRALAEGVDGALPRMKWGTFSGGLHNPPDTYYLVTHDLGVTPAFVAITYFRPQAAGAYSCVYKVISLSSTVMMIEVRDHAGALRTNTQQFMWFVLAA